MQQLKNGARRTDPSGQPPPGLQEPAARSGRTRGARLAPAQMKTNCGLLLLLLLGELSP
jgi:hypothetical protein